MAVIKAQNAASALGEAVVLDLGDLQRQADALRRDAEIDAERIVAEAKERAKQLSEGATEQGYEKGLAEGREAGAIEGREAGREESLAEWRESFDLLHQGLTAAFDQVDASRAALLRDARTAVVRLAIQLAEKLLHRTVEVDGEAVVDQVAAALEHVLRPMDVTVRINANDRLAMDAAIERLQDRFEQFEHIRLVDDETVSRGGCVINCGQGRIDATLETQLQRMVELMLPSK